MQRAVRYAVLLLVIFATSLAIFWVYLARSPRIVSEQALEDYARTYLQEYMDLVEFYGNGFGNLTQFRFCEHYDVLAVVSSAHGAAVFFDSSSKWSFETKTIPERIEFYVWKNMREYENDSFWHIQHPQENGLPNYTISANLQVGDGTTPTYFYVGEKTVATLTNDYTITVKPLGRMRIDGALKYENRMILRGSNNERDWLPKAAVIDATNEFLRIAKDLAVAEAGLRKIAGFDILREKAEQIERNKATGVYEGNEALQQIHEQEFWELADEYDIHPEVAAGIIELAKERYTQQPWYAPYADVFFKVIVGGILTTLIASPFVFILNRWLERKFPPRKNERLLRVQTVKKKKKQHARKKKENKDPHK